MSDDYWAGMFTIPAVLLAIAVAVSALLGAWIIVEKWAEGRLQKLPEVRITRLLGGPGDKFRTRTVTDLGGRGRFAALFLTIDKAWFFKIGPNTGITVIHGKGNQNYDTRFMGNAIRDAVYKAVQAQEEETHD
jgi:hypothetical protein